MSLEYDLLVFIGRLQPFHFGHKHVIKLGLTKAHDMLILVGSSFRARDIKNPFSYEERRSMVEMSLDPQEISRVTIRPLRDHLYNDNKWIAEVQRHVDVLLKDKPPISGKPRIAIIGYEKDNTSWYLRAFPQWEFVDVGQEYIENIDATTIRTMWLSGQSPNFTRGVMRDSVHNFIYNKFPKKEFDRLVREYHLVEQVKKEKALYKYPIFDQTVDAVIIQSGHVLLVQRKAAPGEGLWALPGGYLEPNETLVQGMIRELREETKLKVPEAVLLGSIRSTKTFDAVGRSVRGRIITNAFLIELAPGELPKVKGSDDAAKAKWVALADFEKMEDQMFEDHHHIISYFLGRV